MKVSNHFLAASAVPLPTRREDLLARYGGEEFVCLLPDTGHDDALAMAERMLRAVRLAAKLGFSIHPDAAAPIPAMAPLLTGASSARLFDEVLKLLLAGYRGPEADLKRVTVRALVLRGQPNLSFVYSHERRDVTKNLPVTEGLQALRGWLGPQAFANAHLHTHDEELQLACSRKGRWSLHAIWPRGAIPSPRIPGRRWS